MEIEFETASIHGNISLVPYLSDSYYSLLCDLVRTSKANPQNISYVAGAIIIGVTCIESYLNEVAYMHRFYQDETQNKLVKKRIIEKCGTDLMKKMRIFKENAKDSSSITNDRLDNLLMLIKLRGSIIHYQVEPEKPGDVAFLTKLQKLSKSILGVSFGVSEILSPRTAELAHNIVCDLIKALYKSNYEVPRPRWLAIVDPERYKGKV